MQRKFLIILIVLLYTLVILIFLINLINLQNDYIVQAHQKEIDYLKTKLENLSQEIHKIKLQNVLINKEKVQAVSKETNSFIANLTAYCACEKCCGKKPNHPYYGLTASGKKVQANRTIAMDKKYPFGTIVKIEGLGIFEVQDRGGAIKGNDVDIYMNTHQEALNFGVQQRRVWIIYTPEKP